MLSALICMCNLLFVCASNVTILYVLDTDYVASQDLAADLQQILLPELHVNVISMKNSQVINKLPLVHCSVFARKVHLLALFVHICSAIPV